MPTQSRLIHLSLELTVLTFIRIQAARILFTTWLLGVDMNNYVWSASHVSFFPKAMLQDYESAGWNLSDVVDVVDDIFQTYRSMPPEGKILGVVDGFSPKGVETEEDVKVRQWFVRQSGYKIQNYLHNPQIIFDDSTTPPYES